MAYFCFFRILLNKCIFSEKRGNKNFWYKKHLYGRYVSSFGINHNKLE